MLLIFAKQVARDTRYAAIDRVLDYGVNCEEQGHDIIINRVTSIIQNTPFPEELRTVLGAAKTEEEFPNHERINTAG